MFFHESVQSHQKTKTPITTHVPRIIAQTTFIALLPKPNASLNRVPTGNPYIVAH